MTTTHLEQELVIRHLHTAQSRRCMSEPASASHRGGEKGLLAALHQPTVECKMLA